MFDGSTDTCMDVTSTAEPVSPIHLYRCNLPADPNGIGYNVTVTHSNAFLNNTNNIQVFVFPSTEVDGKYYGKLCKIIGTQILGDDLVSSEFSCPCANVCILNVKALAQGDMRSQGRLCKIDIK